jgi:hypothetical protein
VVNAEQVASCAAAAKQKAKQAQVALYPCQLPSPSL